MSYRGGFGGFGGGNMQNIMRQAQAMQQQMMKAQEELEQAEVTGVSGSGMVTVTMTGKKVIRGIKLMKEAVDPEDVEMLEDLIIAAINDATNKAEELSKDKLSGFGDLGGLM